MKTRTKVALGVGGVVAASGVAILIKKLIEVKKEFQDYDPDYNDSFIVTPEPKAKGKVKKINR